MKKVIWKGIIPKLNGVGGVRVVADITTAKTTIHFDEWVGHDSMGAERWDGMSRESIVIVKAHIAEEFLRDEAAKAEDIVTR